MTDKHATPSASGRTFTTEIKQAEGKGFEKVGEAHEGTYLGIKKVQLTEDNGAKRDGHLIMLQPDGGGDKFGVWANAVLLDLITEVDPGKYVRISYTGNGKQKGKKSGAKLFRVQVAD